jgi:hypothetical protein
VSRTRIAAKKVLWCSGRAGELEVEVFVAGGSVYAWTDGDTCEMERERKGGGGREEGRDGGRDLDDEDREGSDCCRDTESADGREIDGRTDTKGQPVRQARQLFRRGV